MTDISILMPCHNAEATLGGAIESIERQSYQDFELVAVDDGSTDGTPQVLARWARTDARIRVISQPHGGIITALNAGLAACRSELIARMDADDLAHPDRLRRQIEFLKAQPEVAVVGCLVEAFPRELVRQGFRVYLEWQNALVTDEEIRKEIFVESPFAHPSVAFRRKWIQQVGGYQERGWAEDYDLWLRLYLARARFGKIAAVLHYWNERPDRLTRTDRRYSLENFLRAKAYYLARGPLQDRDSVILWGAGMTGRRISKHLLRQAVPLKAFVDIDPRKIGRTRYGLPILTSEALPEVWRSSPRPAVLSAVGARGARQLIRSRLTGWGLREGRDWWSVA